MLLLVFLALAAAELVAVRLWDEFYPVQPRYLDRSLPTLTLGQKQFTEAQKRSAVDLVRASGIVERINGGQAWDITEVRDRPGIRAVNVYVEWDEPVKSNGPWLTSGASNWLGRSCRNVRPGSTCPSETCASCGFRSRSRGWKSSGYGQPFPAGNRGPR